MDKLVDQLSAKDAQQTGRQIGKQINEGVTQGLKKNSNVLKELEKTYQSIKNLQIQKSTLDPIADSSKLAKLNEEIAKAKKNYDNAFRSVNKSGNLDVSAWNELKTAIDSATKSKIEYNNTEKADDLNEQEDIFKSLGNAEEAAQSLIQSFSLDDGVEFIISNIKNAVLELKEVDTLLMEIGKVNKKLSASDLSDLGANSFNVASKYGIKATDYLSGVQEASRAGYENAEAMAELSIAAQEAGDINTDIANQFLIAADKAYKLNGSIEELAKAMDGINYITSHNAINMAELSEGISIAASTAAASGVGINELTAALGTMSSATQESGSEVARAFKTILLNIRQITDEEEGIDAEGLAKYEQACNDLGVSLKETRDGVLALRDPMKVLEELSAAYNKLDESDVKRTNLLNSVGSVPGSTQLDALLQQWDTYKTMLQQYEDGSGSIAIEAEKTAQSWEGSLNRLSNTWTDTIGNATDSGAISTLINGLNSLLSVINKITDALGPSATIGLGAGLFAGIKNVGGDKMYSLNNYCFE